MLGEYKKGKSEPKGQNEEFKVRGKNEMGFEIHSIY